LQAWRRGPASASPAKREEVAYRFGGVRVLEELPHLPLQLAHVARHMRDYSSICMEVSDESSSKVAAKMGIIASRD
jgi:hypothetical protein